MYHIDGVGSTLSLFEIAVSCMIRHRMRHYNMAVLPRSKVWPDPQPTDLRM